MSDAHFALIKLFVLGENGRHYSRDEVETAVSDREITRRLRELRDSKWGSFNVRCDGDKGYIYVPDDSAVVPELLQQRRDRVLKKAALS